MKHLESFLNRNYYCEAEGYSRKAIQGRPRPSQMPAVPCHLKLQKDRDTLIEE